MISDAESVAHICEEFSVEKVETGDGRWGVFLNIRCMNARELKPVFFFSDQIPLLVEELRKKMP